MQPRYLAATLLASVTLASAAHAENVVRTDDAWLDAGGMLQLVGLGEHVNDPYRSDNRLYLFAKEARLKMSGGYRDIGFNLEVGMGGEDAIVTPTNVSLGLLDFSLNLPVPNAHWGYFKVGQFKVPYGREELTYSGYNQFAERSIDYAAFQVGRDVGVSFNTRFGLFNGIAGVFTGGGRDVPPAHYLPQQLGVPLVVARLGVGNIEDDPYALKPNMLDADRTRFAVDVSGMYTKDSVVGHSSVLNVKLANKSLLLDSNWNPYISQQPLSLGQWWQTGIDAAVRVPLAPGIVAASEAEADYGGFDNEHGHLRIGGVRAQASVLFDNFEPALRYAVLVNDPHFSNGGVPITGSTAIHEITPALNWYLIGYRLKLIADVPVYLNDPVFTEPKVGSYVGTELPDQASVLGKGGTVNRRTVVEGRVLMQGWF